MIEANECLSGGEKAMYYPRGLEESQPNGSPRAVMVRNVTAKLVYRPTGVSELYDLVQGDYPAIDVKPLLWKLPSEL